MENATWSIVPCRPTEVRLLVQELGLSHTAASVLARRGYADPIRAAAFLAGALPGHDPLPLRRPGAGAARIRGAVEAGETICVHGDYDADGICATALAVF